MRINMLLIVFFALLEAAGSYAAVAETATLRVMTFNIRFGTAEDGENRWDHRKDFVVDTVAAFDPDIVGYQEMMPFQESYVQDRLPGFGLSGSVQNLEGRPQRAESAQITWKTERFDKLENGMFYLSQTPDRPGGDDWDSRVARRVEWVKLRDKQAGRDLFVFNTHFDHIGQVARLEGARLMRQRMENIAGDAPLIVLGDFNNHAPDAAPYQAILAAPSGGTEAPPRLIDTFVAANPDADWTGTFNGFDGKPDRQKRIDWVLHTPHFTAESAEINRVKNDAGRFPSDHYPVQAVLRWTGDNSD